MEESSGARIERPDDMLGAKEAAASAGVTTGSLSRWILNGVVDPDACTKMRGRWTVRRSEIARINEEHERRIREAESRAPLVTIGPTWTPEADAELSALRGQGKSWSQIAAEMHRSVSSCSGRWMRLQRGVPAGGGSGTEWTEEELRFVVDNYARMSCRTIADKLGRTEGAVYAAGRRLGLLRPERGGARANTGRRSVYGVTTRRCHDCGRPSGGNYRCARCRAEFNKKHGVEAGAYDND